MIEVSERARQELKKLLSATTDKVEESLRLVVGNSGELGLALDTEVPGDKIIEHENSKVLLVEERLASHLDGMTIDVEDTPEGSRLVISKNDRASD